MSPDSEFDKLINKSCFSEKGMRVSLFLSCMCVQVLKRECVGRNMPYKDCVLQNDSLTLREKETTVAQAILSNQSPLIKGWFLLMVVNLALFLIFMH